MPRFFAENRYVLCPFADTLDALRADGGVSVHWREASAADPLVLARAARDLGLYPLEDAVRGANFVVGDGQYSVLRALIYRVRCAERHMQRYGTPDHADGDQPGRPAATADDEDTDAKYGYDTMCDNGMPDRGVLYAARAYERAQAGAADTDNEAAAIATELRVRGETPAPLPSEQDVHAWRLLWQLYIDSHLDLALYAAGHGVCSDEALCDDTQCAHSPMQSALALYEPHPLRCTYEGELPSLTPALLHGNMWHVMRPKNAGVLGMIVHLFICKPHSHKCQVRNLTKIQHDNHARYPVLLAVVRALLEVSLLGNYWYCAARPRFCRRLEIRRMFHERSTPNDNDLLLWMNENEQLVFFAMREFYLFQVESHPIVRELLCHTEHWTHLETIVRRGMDRMRATFDTNGPDRPRDTDEATRTRFRGVAAMFGALHKQHLPFTSKLRKGHFHEVLLTEANKQYTWVARREHHCRTSDEELGSDELLERLRQCAEEAARVVDVRGRFETRWLHVLGMSAAGVERVRRLYFDYEHVAVADNRLLPTLAALYEGSRHDFHLLRSYLLWICEARAIRIYRLPESMRQMQLRSLRLRHGIEPWRDLPAGVDVHHFCRACNEWASQVVDTVTAANEHKHSANVATYGLGMFKPIFDASSGELYCGRHKSAAATARRSAEKRVQRARDSMGGGAATNNGSDSEDEAQLVANTKALIAAAAEASSSAARSGSTNKSSMRTAALLAAAAAEADVHSDSGGDPTTDTENDDDDEDNDNDNDSSSNNNDSDLDGTASGARARRRRVAARGLAAARECQRRTPLENRLCETQPLVAVSMAGRVVCAGGRLWVLCTLTGSMIEFNAQKFGPHGITSGRLERDLCLQLADDATLLDVHVHPANNPAADPLRWHREQQLYAQRQQRWGWLYNSARALRTPPPLRQASASLTSPTAMAALMDAPAMQPCAFCGENVPPASAAVVPVLVDDDDDNTNNNKSGEANNASSSSSVEAAIVGGGGRQRARSSDGEVHFDTATLCQRHYQCVHSYLRERRMDHGVRRSDLMNHIRRISLNKMIQRSANTGARYGNVWKASDRIDRR